MIVFNCSMEYLVCVCAASFVGKERSNVIFWPSTRPKNTIPRWCTGRKWHIPMATNRKRSRGRIKAYNMGQGEGPTAVMHRKRVTCELHDSYFRLMTIKHSISKIQRAIVWALNYYIIELSWVPKQLPVEFQTVETRCGREGHTRPKGLSETPDRVSPRLPVEHQENKKGTKWRS